MTKELPIITPGKRSKRDKYLTTCLSQKRTHKKIYLVGAVLFEDNGRMTLLV